MPDDKAKLYLDYLDKEMTIMGILSTFSVAAVAAILNKLLSIEDKQTMLQAIWAHGSYYISFASVLMLLSALCFYCQRSHLAWHYGQICLCLTREPSGVNDQLDAAHSWETWIHYRWAFGFLTLAAAEYVAGLASANPSPLGRWFFEHQELCMIAPAVLLLLLLLFIRRVLTRHKDVDAPFRTYWKTFSRNA